jgi:hypothetical protein
MAHHLIRGHALDAFGQNTQIFSGPGSATEHQTQTHDY